MVQVVWFKRDLRTQDHRPLHMAAMRAPVLPLYVVEPAYWTQPDTSRRQWLFLEGALRDLGSALGRLGAPLILRTGQVVDVLRDIHQHHGIERGNRQRLDL
jgi:deoxyribodipyrimidine photo-lyase